MTFEEYVEDRLKQPERIRKIDTLMKDAAMVCEEDDEEGKKSGVLTVCLGTYDKAEELMLLLIPSARSHDLTHRTVMMRGK